MALALWNNAPLQAALADLGFAKAELLDSRRVPNPVFSFLFPMGPKQMEASVSWNLGWMWQIHKDTKSAALDFQAVAEQLLQNGLDVARDASIAHAEVVLARRQLDLSRQASQAWSEILRLAEIRRRAGASSEVEVGIVRTDAQIARIAERVRKRDLEVARARLRQIVGASSPHLTITAGALPSVKPKLAPLIQAALVARPDVRASELVVESAGARSGTAVTKIFDVVATLDSNGQGSDFEAGPGLGVRLPIFDRNPGERLREKSALERANWTYLGARRAVINEVTVAHARYRQVSDALSAWPAGVVAPMEKNVKLANQAYANGSSSHLAVLDATRRLIAARKRQAALEAELRKSMAELERAVGRQIDESFE